MQEHTTWTCLAGANQPFSRTAFQGLWYYPPTGKSYCTCCNRLCDDADATGSRNFKSLPSSSSPGYRRLMHTHNTHTPIEREKINMTSRCRRRDNFFAGLQQQQAGYINWKLEHLDFLIELDRKRGRERAAIGLSFSRLSTTALRLLLLRYSFTHDGRRVQ